MKRALQPLPADAAVRGAAGRDFMSALDADVRFAHDAALQAAGTDAEPSARRQFVRATAAYLEGMVTLLRHVAHHYALTDGASAAAQVLAGIRDVPPPPAGVALPSAMPQYAFAVLTEFHRARRERLGAAAGPAPGGPDPDLLATLQRVYTRRNALMHPDPAKGGLDVSDDEYRDLVTAYVRLRHEITGLEAIVPGAGRPA